MSCKSPCRNLLPWWSIGIELRRPEALSGGFNVALPRLDWFPETVCTLVWLLDAPLFTLFCPQLPFFYELVQNTQSVSRRAATSALVIGESCSWFLWWWRVTLTESEPRKEETKKNKKTHQSQHKSVNRQSTDFWFSFDIALVLL